MTGSDVWKWPEQLPEPGLLADAWTAVVSNAIAFAKHNATTLGQELHAPAYDVASIAEDFSSFAGQWWQNPVAAMEAGQAVAKEWSDLWLHGAERMLGLAEQPLHAPARGDRRFSDPAWNDEALFDYLKQAYLLAGKQAAKLVQDAPGLDEGARGRVSFFTQAFLDALSPANFAMTNPEAIRRAIDTGSISLLGGLANMLADAATESRQVRRRASGDGFVLGETIAATPGSVVFQNELMQLIQYKPTTKRVERRPLLYVPPLVNKYYMLDLQPHSSLLRWLVEQGHSVFVISWINPGADLGDKGIGDYIRLGPLAALDAIEQATGERTIDIFGFCMGGTLAGITAAVLAARGEGERLASLTTIGSMFDFRDMRQWATFSQVEQLKAMERHVGTRKYLSANDLQALFSLVRANDLIWPSVVSHYLLDKQVPPSDLLHWFADGANIPARFMLDWAKSVLAENALTHGGMLVVDDTPVDLGAVKTPFLCVSLKDDHVSAWEATYDGARLFGGPVGFLLGGSGHNAGVINPPAANKHGYWINADLPDSAQLWLDGAERREGSWWPQWRAWLVRDGEDPVAARAIGRGGLKAIEPAPGSYARMAA